MVSNFKQAIGNAYSKLPTSVNAEGFTPTEELQQSTGSTLGLSLGGLNLADTNKKIEEDIYNKNLAAQAQNQNLDAYNQGANDSFNNLLKNIGSGAGKIVDTAKTYLGQNRYTYGGFDCSKFVQEVAGRAGAAIPRDTASQMSFFKKNGMWSTNMSGIKPGDIIYFGSSASPSGRHTGIYIGNGAMIDNSGRGKPISVRPISGRTVLGYGRTSAFKTGGDAVETKKTMTNKRHDTVNGLEPNFLGRLSAANRAMKDAGLGTFTISSGHRTRSEQTQLNAEDPGRYAKPGHSLHEVGLSADLNLAKKQHEFLTSVAKKFGLYQPDPKEPWHWQPLG